VPILICIPFKFMGKPYYASRRAELEADLTPEQRRRVSFITSDTAEDLIQRYSFGDRWPSSGLLTIWHFVHAPPQPPQPPPQQPPQPPTRAGPPSPPLLLLGFDFFKEIDGKIHYMEDDCKARHRAPTRTRTRTRTSARTPTRTPAPRQPLTLTFNPSRPTTTPPKRSAAAGTCARRATWPSS